MRAATMVKPTAYVLLRQPGLQALKVFAAFGEEAAEDKLKLDFLLAALPRPR